MAHSNGATEETVDYLEGLGKPTRDGEAPRHRVALLAGGGSHPHARPGGTRRELEERAPDWSWDLGWKMQPWHFDLLSSPPPIPSWSLLLASGRRSKPCGALSLGVWGMWSVKAGLQGHRAGWGVDQEDMAGEDHRLQGSPCAF